MCPSFKLSPRAFKDSSLHRTNLLLKQTALLFVYITFAPFRHKFLAANVILHLNIGLCVFIHKVSLQSAAPVQRCQNLSWAWFA